MELENVLLQDRVDRLQAELEKNKRQLDETKRVEKLLKNQVDHLLKFAYSDDRCAEKNLVIMEKQKEIKKLQKRNRELKKHINFLYRKTLKIRF